MYELACYEKFEELYCIHVPKKGIGELIKSKRIKKEEILKKLVEYYSKKNKVESGHNFMGKCIPVLIIGASGSGKSTSMRNFNEKELGVVNVLSKPLPFKNSLKMADTDNYEEIKQIIANAKTPAIVIDDSNYLITNEFMRTCKDTGFQKYNDMGNHFWDLVNFTKNLDGVTVPDGFSNVKVTVEGNEYEVLTNSNGTIVLYYLVDASGQNGNLYVYSSAKDAVYPYVVLTNSNYSYMVDEVANPQVPEGYQKVNMVIKGAGGAGAEVSVIAWYHKDAPDFYLLYASCNGGDPELYQYDVNENTIQRFNGIKGTTQVVEGSDNTEKVNDLEEKVKTLEKEKKSEAKTWMLVVIVLAVLCIVLVVIVVALFYKMRDQMEYESYDDDDYDDDYVASAAADDDDGMVSAPRTEKKSVKADFDDDDDFTFFDMDDDR